MNLWEKRAADWSLLSVRAGGDLTITGNGTLKAKENDCYAVDVQDGATLTIENGTFVGNIHAVYVYQGELTVKGGAYSIQQKYPDTAKADEFVLNCYDKHRTEGTAKITVTGGTFVKFNPPTVPLRAQAPTLSPRAMRQRSSKMTNMKSLRSLTAAPVRRKIRS